MSRVKHYYLPGDHMKERPFVASEWYGMEELPLRSGVYDIWHKGTVFSTAFSTASASWTCLELDLLPVKYMRWRGIWQEDRLLRTGSSFGYPRQVKAPTPPAYEWPGALLSVSAPDYEEVWVSRDGRRTAVCDMHVDHLRNALRMILKAKRELDEINAAVIAKRVKVPRFARALDRAQRMKDDEGRYERGCS